MERLAEGPQHRLAFPGDQRIAYETEVLFPLAGLDPDEALLFSAKEGLGIEKVLEAIVERIPPPKGSVDRPLSALIFDANYDPFRGSIISCRVFDGTVRPGETIRLMSNDATYRVEEVGIFRLQREPRSELPAGAGGYIICGIKTVSATRIGDTITLDADPAPAPLPGFRQVKPVVFSSIYPVASDGYEDLAVAMITFANGATHPSPSGSTSVASPTSGAG